MSSDSTLGHVHHHAAEGGHGAQQSSGFDAQATPRPFLPSVDTMTPEVAEHVSTRHRAAPAPDTPHPQDYFTSALPSTVKRSSIPSLETSPSPSVSASDATASGLIQPVESIASIHSSPRPPAQTQISNLSIESTDSTATALPPLSVTAANAQRPSFPNQSYAALQEQIHPRSHIPKRGGTNPHQIFTFSSAIASLHPNGARSSHNESTTTPLTGGLFGSITHSPQPALESPGSSGTYASPFLHFTHTHVPKETHVADVDVDPISGRKLINHYEIIDELGRGTHGKVKLGRDLETKDTYVAIKIVERFSKRRKLGRLGTTEDKVKKEVAILKNARHPNIVALLEVIDDPSRKKVYIVLEWVERGEIHWREKGPKEIAMIEARRYERERAGQTSGYDQRTVVEDEAVLVEAQKRLARQKRKISKAFRQMKRETAAQPEAWSLEMAGDETSEESGDDRLSRMSGDSMSLSARLLGEDLRQPPRTPSPMPPDDDFLTRSPTLHSVTSQPEVISPIDLRRSSSSLMAASSLAGLEGTHHVTQDSSLHHTTRIASLSKSLRSVRRGSADGLARLAAEILDSDLDSDLQYVPVMTMEQIRVTFRDTLVGLQYLHYQGIVHRDIKPPNLLVTYDNRTKISDFGVSYLGKPVLKGEPGEEISEAEAQDLDDEAKELAKTVGTPAFYAPELCNTDPTDEPLPVTKAIDVWALGITLFCMLFARTPFVDNEFVVMRQIADEEVYIPRQRLQPVDSKPRSRGSSHGRAFPPAHSGRRGEMDLVYEEIGDELHDLLKRLLIKDPQKRITLEEVRHHPWVVANLPDKIEWLEETNPSRQSKGKKITVSSEDMNTAVVPLNLVERMRSGLKKVGERFGLGSKPSSSRLRAQSLSHRDSSAPPTAGGFDGQEDRMGKSRGDETIIAALKASRDSDYHPLARSMTAFSETDEEGYFDTMPTRTTSRQSVGPRKISPPRPSPPHRAVTVTPASGSMRTVKQSDFRANSADSPPPSPALPGTPVALASSNAAALGNVLGGTGRRIIQAVKEKSAPWVVDYKGPPSERGSVDSFDSHAEPSLAISTTMAAGHVNRPDALQEPLTRSSAQATLASSRVNSSADHLRTTHNEKSGLSRASSLSSTASRGRGRAVTIHASGVASDGSRPHSRTAGDSNIEDYNRADAERIRRFIAEKRDEAERGRISRPSSAISKPPLDCPPSPDDSRPKRGDSRNTSVTDSSMPSIPDTPYRISPITSSAHMMSSSSDLASAISASISNPSIPSVISEASSMDAVDFSNYQIDDKRGGSSDDTLKRSPRQLPSSSSSIDRLEEGYTPDAENALDSDENEDDYASSSDSDGGLQMTRRKSTAKHGGKGGLAAAQEASRQLGTTGIQHQRRNTGLSIRSRKSSRSGSNNTMRKIRTRDSIDEQRRGSTFGMMEE